MPGDECRQKQQCLEKEKGQRREYMNESVFTEKQASGGRRGREGLAGCVGASPTGRRAATSESPRDGPPRTLQAALRGTTLFAREAELAERPEHDPKPVFRFQSRKLRNSGAPVSRSLSGKDEAMYVHGS